MRTPVPMNSSLFTGVLRALNQADEVAERASQQHLRTETRVGDYILRKHVATGGFGAVWHAVHAETGEDVAVKVLHPYLVSSEDAVSRFEREIRVITRIRHPNIVELLDNGRLDDGRPYLVTEFLHGTDLDSYIEEHGALAPDLALEILEQLAAALAAAHDEKIVHRDVKASNVVLSQHEGRLRVVLVDFGIAKLLDGSSPDLTVSNVLVGSLACISPEQILNQTVDARTDVYALGSLTYHMLTGAPPFSSAAATEIVNLHLERDPPVPSSVCALSPALDRVMMKALRKQREDRFPDAQAFTDAFRDAMTAARAATAPAPAPVQARPRAVGIFVEAGAAAGALAEPDDALLDDLDELLARAERYLERKGYRVARERGNAVLFVRLLTHAEARDASARHLALSTARRLFTELARRPGRDPRTRLRVCVHEADVCMSGEDVGGGSLLQLEDWLPKHWEEGVFGSATIITTLPGIGGLGDGMSRRRRRPGRTGKPCDSCSGPRVRLARPVSTPAPSAAPAPRAESLAHSDTLPAFFCWH